MTRKAIPVKKSVAHHSAAAGRPTTAVEKRAFLRTRKRVAKSTPGRPKGSAVSGSLGDKPATKENLLAECRVRFHRDFGESWTHEYTETFALVSIDEALSPASASGATRRQIAISKARKEIKRTLTAMRTAVARAIRLRDATRASFVKAYGSDRATLDAASKVAGLDDLANVVAMLPAILSSSGPLLTTRLAGNDDPRAHDGVIAETAPAFFERARLAPRELACVLILARRGRIDVRSGETVQDVLARVSARFRQRARRARAAL